MTTALERLAAAIKGEPSDRIPVFCNLFDQGAAELGLPPEEYYSKGAHVAEAQLRMLRKYGHDNVWAMFHIGREAELLGCRKILYAPDGPPNVQDHVIKTLDDIETLEVPADVLSHPLFAETRTCLDILRREVGGKTLICAYVTAPLTLPALLMGMDHWLELLLAGPADVRDELLARCHDFFVSEVAAYRKSGADILFYGNAFASTDMIPMEFYQNMSLPCIERDIAAVGSADLAFFCTGACYNDIIDSLINRIGFGVFYLSPLSDVAEAKRIIAGRALTCAAFNDVKLIGWSAGEIRREVKRIIDAGMPGGKFAFSTGIMPCAIPERNIHTMLDAACEFGRYGNGSG